MLSNKITGYIGFNVLCIKHGSETFAETKNHLLMCWKQPLFNYLFLFFYRISVYSWISGAAQTNTEHKDETWKKENSERHKQMLSKWPPRRVTTKSKPWQVSQVLSLVRMSMGLKKVTSRHSWFSSPLSLNDVIVMYDTVQPQNLQPWTPTAVFMLHFTIKCFAIEEKLYFQDCLKIYQADFTQKFSYYWKDFRTTSTLLLYPAISYTYFRLVKILKSGLVNSYSSTQHYESW